MPSDAAEVPDACYELLEFLEARALNGPQGIHGVLLQDLPRTLANPDILRVCESRGLIRLRFHPLSVPAAWRKILPDTLENDPPNPPLNPKIALQEQGRLALAERRLRQELTTSDAGSAAPGKAPPREAKEKLAAGAVRETEPQSEAAVARLSKRKEPHARAFLAYRLHRFSGMRQNDIGGQFGKSQKTISTWIKRVREWCEAGNPLPDSEAVSRKIRALDPAVLELGARIEGRTPRQRHKADR